MTSGATAGPAVPLTGIQDDWCRRLGTGHPRVLLADGDDERVVAAAAVLAASTPVSPVLLREGPDGALPAGVSAVSPATLRADPAVTAGLTRRPGGGARADEEVTALAADPLALGVALLGAGGVAACVAGATRTTGDVIRAGLRVLGTAPGVGAVSSCFLLVLPDGRRLAYGDCAVLPTPDTDQLADVATSTADTFRQLCGEDPQVAMLSFSTKGSADHPEVTRVREATELVRARRPALSVDGELQFDAAVVEAVARTKAAGSPVAGHANVLVFPDLAAGNIGYKITERLGHAAAYGPILQGLAAPLNDLSRGCSVADVVAVSLLSAVQAAAEA